MSDMKNDGNSPVLKSSEVITHLKRCQKITGDQARDAFVEYLRGLDEAFLQAIDEAASNQEVAEISGIQRLFVRNRDDLIHYYCGYIAEGFVKFKKKELRTVNSSQEEGQSGLSLLENDELEETIAISTITQKLDAYLAEPLWALNQRFALLNGGERVTEASNPSSPIQYCESLRKSLRLIPLNPRTNALAYKVFEPLLGELVANVVNNLNEYLGGAGLLPDLQYNKPSSGNQTEGGTSRITGPRPGMGEQGGGSPAQQTSLLQDIRSLQEAMLANQEQIAATQALSNQAVAAVFSQNQLMGALQNIQPGGAQLPVQVDGGAGVAPSFGISPAQLIQNLTEQLKANSGSEAEVGSSDMHTIDLVGMLFEYMLSDDNIPDSVKALLSYMHTPFLKLAFLDPGFFERPEHPARILLNSLAEAGSRWVSNDGSAEFDMLEKIKGVVDRVLTEFKDDISVISDLLEGFTGETKKILRRQELMEKRATEKAQGEERLREVKIKVNTEVLKRTDDKDLPSAVLLFLLQPWSDYLSFALLRYGDDSKKWRDALGLVDNLLWAVEPKNEPDDLAQQMTLATSLIEEISQGFETIGYDQGKGATLLESLSALIQSAVDQKEAEPAPAPMRDELEKVAAEKAGATIEEEPFDLNEEEAKLVEHLKLIEFGTWFEFDGGKRLKVAWFNARTLNYMLVDQKGKKVAMMAGVELAREVISKRAKIISGSSKPFFERALDNIFQKLNAEASANAQAATED